ncbi:MAG: threonine ammonia-lyase [Deltaproteobacteria bacterium GWA2_38_16]|nr:MAG: threonine ammonia-lyase [Deltaproteobacteria bacterium GWA2_38_16]OGQ02226.1 MAG: threonine ammonia-lyase [Deltaproteobacteria bacterium RIFCSPHIGHO2_02_FULL_38_15]HBQ21775.1 threonine ammonia-lyase [Deltaproteobacteria bacterium]
MKSPTLEDIQKAQKVIKDAILHTPLKRSNYFSELFLKNIYFKMENLQHTGAFKVRGARNKLLSLTDAEKKQGVITASAGNHAQGVAYQAKLLGTPSTIVMPESTPMGKVQATKSYGAKVILKGLNYDEAYEEALRLQEEMGAIFIHAYEDPFIIAGQGTIGLEILEEEPKTEVIIVPIGGGGLISGIAIAAKSLNPKIKIIGVQADGAATMAESLKKGKACVLASMSTMAEGIAVKKASPYTFGFIQQYVDEVVTVSDEDIAVSILQLLEKTKMIVEGAGAVTLASLLSKKLHLKEKNIVCLLSGGNLDVTTLAHIIERGLVQEGRMVRLSVTVDDIPGSLQKLTKIIADLKANIMQVNHERQFLNVSFGKTKILLTLETKGPEHIKEILHKLESSGYSPKQDE